ncbi:hypothetical protein BCR35DRAFT_306724 [Leucosporidium creatinivorum]|uniref:UDP-glucose:Glyco protein glucosyltransferase-domain-containing protein n=1 Tax=Leucosporidium creatinivorum TaxID=106004 RepID=A0A1Y2ERU0_9BASI|nr:hypothetical protein BCR35DRAFT_306724 [Leucosporidium creatinivorum]
MRFGAVVLASAFVLPALADSQATPQLSVRVDSNEHASHLIPRFLECVAAEKPSALHPFLSFLTANKVKPTITLSAPEFEVKTGLNGKKQKSKYTQHNPLFTRLLLPNETYTLLDTGLARSRATRERGEQELIRLALASGQADEVVEIMRGVWERREAEIEELQTTKRSCESWIDVRGIKVCNVEQFWAAVGAKAKVGSGPIKVIAKGDDPMDLGFDVLLPAKRDTALPFVVLYATPVDEEFPALYDLLSALAQPKFGRPRLQFAVRWKPDTQAAAERRPIPLFSAKLDIKEGSIPAVDSADLSELGVRATAHILKSEDPLSTFVSLAANLPIVAPQLSTLVPTLPDDLAATVQAHPIEPSFTINGVPIPFDKIEPLALIRHLRAERPAVSQLQGLHKELVHRDAREALMAEGLSEAEEIQGRAEKNLIKPSPANPLKIVNLVEATEGLPKSFIHSSYIEGVAPDNDDDAERVDPPAITTIYIVADLDSRNGRKLAQEALKFIDTHTAVRVSFVHNPEELALPEHAYELSSLIYNLISSGNLCEVFPAELSTWLTFDIDESGPEKPLDEMWTEENPMTPFVANGASKEEQEKALVFWKSTAALAERAGLKAGASGLIINGRVVELRGLGFPSNNFRLLYEYELAQRIKPVVASLEATISAELRKDRISLAHVFSMATSIVSKSLLPVGKPVRSRPYLGLPIDYPAFITGGRKEHALYEIGVVVDPISELAQKWAPILKTLATLNNVVLKVYLAPSVDVSSPPARTLHTTSFPASLEFDDALELKKPVVLFAGLPDEAVVSLSVQLREYGSLTPSKEVQEAKAGQLVGEEVVYRFQPGPGPDAEEEEEEMPEYEEESEEDFQRRMNDQSHLLRVKDEL